MPDQIPSLPVPAIGGNSFQSTDGQVPVIDIIKNDTYNVVSTNWYKSLPYGFSFFRIGSKPGSLASVTVYLPIAPQNITTTTHFATNVITTLYGIVEEHSEVRYYDITISGTTGFAPRYTQPFGAGGLPADQKSDGRAAFEKQGLDFGGFLPEVAGIANQALNLADSILSPGGGENKTGIKPDQSGYAAFHNLYRAFLSYKVDAAQVNQVSANTSLTGSIAAPEPDKPTRSVHPIQFLNYKDGIQYDCVPLAFTLVRSAENPMLYNYNIKLRAFNLRNVHAKVSENNQLAKLGLKGLEGLSTFAAMTSIAGNAATLIGGLL